MAGTSSQCCGKVLRRGSFITVGQFTTPRSPTTLSYTNQRCTGLSKATAICALSVVSRSSGILSPNFALDIRLVQLSLCSCACESQLINPYLIFMALYPPCRSCGPDVSVTYLCLLRGSACRS